MPTFALIPAAGAGARLSAGSPKQYLPLAGKPMLWHAIRAVCVPPVETVFVVLAPGDDVYARHDWSAFGDRLQPLYCGGASRRDSVYNGLVATMACLEPDDWMLVHDAARPCLPEADLRRLLATCADEEAGGLLAIPVSDTVKRAGPDETGAPRVARTEDRRTLWLAQTPQVFRVGLLARALKAAPPEVTDESAALEAAGVKPRLVHGSRENLKVTYPDDLAVAEAILKGRR